MGRGLPLSEVQATDWGTAQGEPLPPSVTEATALVCHITLFIAMGVSAADGEGRSKTIHLQVSWPLTGLLGEFLLGGVQLPGPAQLLCACVRKGCGTHIPGVWYLLPGVISAIVACSSRSLLKGTAVFGNVSPWVCLWHNGRRNTGLQSVLS